MNLSDDLNDHLIHSKLTVVWPNVGFERLRVRLKGANANKVPCTEADEAPFGLPRAKFICTSTVITSTHVSLKPGPVGGTSTVLL